MCVYTLSPQSSAETWGSLLLPHAAVDHVASAAVDHVASEFVAVLHAIMVILCDSVV